MDHNGNKPHLCLKVRCTRTFTFCLQFPNVSAPNDVAHLDNAALSIMQHFARSSQKLAVVGNKKKTKSLKDSLHRSYNVVAFFILSEVCQSILPWEHCYSFLQHASATLNLLCRVYLTRRKFNINSSYFIQQYLNLRKCCKLLTGWFQCVIGDKADQFS